MKIRQYWIATFEGHALATFTSPEQFDKFNVNKKFGCTTCPMIDCQKCGVFPRMGGDECPVCGDTQDANYHLEVIIDTSKFAGTDGDDAWEFPGSYETPGLQIRPDYGFFMSPHKVEGPYSEVETRFREDVLEEWRNLVINNEFIGTKIKLIFDVERVFQS